LDLSDLLDLLCCFQVAIPTTWHWHQVTKCHLVLVPSSIVPLGAGTKQPKPGSWSPLIGWIRFWYWHQLAGASTRCAWYQHQGLPLSSTTDVRSIGASFLGCVLGHFVEKTRLNQ